jgi:hypothetical protein
VSEDIKKLVESNQKILVDYLYKHLLDRIYFVICCEFRHIGDSIHWSNRTEFESWMVDQGQEKLYTAFISHRFTRKKGYAYLNRKNYSQIDIVRLADHAFNDFKWISGYGGKAWGQVAKAWLRLYDAKTFGDKVVAIDHIFDLEHNNGTIFDKLPEYYKFGYDWIHETLEKKKNIESLWEMWNDVSSDLKPLMRKTLKVCNDETMESCVKYIERYS